MLPASYSWRVRFSLFRELLYGPHQVALRSARASFLFEFAAPSFQMFCDTLL